MVRKWTRRSPKSMLSKYKKTDAPEWQQRLVLILASLTGVTFLLFLAWAVMLFVDWARVDDCLDQGGRFNYETAECEFEPYPSRRTQ